MAVPTAVPQIERSNGTPARVRSRWTWTTVGVTVGLLVSLLAFRLGEPLPLLGGLVLTFMALVAFLSSGMARDTQRQHG